MRLTLAILENTLLTALASLVMAISASGQGWLPGHHPVPGETSETFDHAIKRRDAERDAFFALLRKKCHTLLGSTLAQCIDSLDLSARYLMTVHFRPEVGAGAVKTWAFATFTSSMATSVSLKPPEPLQSTRLSGSTYFARTSEC
jgi:hypothetical protein